VIRLSSLLVAGLLVSFPAQAETPNVLLIVAEDLGPRIGAFGDSVAQTPRIDRLAEQGVRYTNVFTAAGVCAPSRAALITGLHPIAWGGQHMRASSRPGGGYAAVPPPTMKAFPELLRAAGHYTYNVQKTDYQLGGTLGGGPFTIWDANGWRVAGDDWPTDRPFFGMVNLGVTHESGVFAPIGSWPHSPTHAVMQLARLFQYTGSAPRAAAPTDPNSVELPPYYPDHPALRGDLARHYDNIATLDAQVGALLDQLEASGLAESTIVVWTTDHGDGLPRAKRELYDSGLHVPMIVRYPAALLPTGALPGSIDERLISFVDLAPTILEWMNTPVPTTVHGRSFANRDAPERRYVYAQRDRIDAVVDRQRAVRDERFKYIRSWHPEVAGGHRLEFRDNQDGMRALWELLEADQLDPVQRRWFEPVAAERLYDTHSDPHELTDLSDDPAHHETLVRMRGALEAWLARIGDTSEEPEEQMAERFWPGGEQPRTQPPRISAESDRIELASPTSGASLAYRIEPEEAWRLYTQPIAASLLAGRSLETKAVRYGYADSEVTSWRGP
jgi:arylsulfatase A-like enzyme